MPIRSLSQNGRFLGPAYAITVGHVCAARVLQLTACGRVHPPCLPTNTDRLQQARCFRVISRDIPLLLALGLTIEQFVTAITAMARHNGYTTSSVHERKGETI